jgi:hypothetical protein
MDLEDQSRSTDSLLSIRSENSVLSIYSRGIGTVHRLRWLDTVDRIHWLSAVGLLDRFVAERRFSAECSVRSLFDVLALATLDPHDSSPWRLLWRNAWRVSLNARRARAARLP